MHAIAAVCHIVGMCARCVIVERLWQTVWPTHRTACPWCADVWKGLCWLIINAFILINPSSNTISLLLTRQAQRLHLLQQIVSLLRGRRALNSSTSHMILFLRGVNTFPNSEIVMSSTTFPFGCFVKTLFFLIRSYYLQLIHSNWLELLVLS